MITSLFGIDVSYENWDKEDLLPLYIAGSYMFWKASIYDIHFIIIEPKEELVTLPALKKQILKIQEIDNVPVVLKMKSVSNYRRKSLIESKIPFITDRQVFLPFIGTLLVDDKIIEKPIEKIDKFVFSTQLLCLFYIYNRKKKMYISEAAKILPFTAMTLTRAVKQLESTGMFITSKDGVNKIIESKYERIDLFKNGKKYLLNPVIKSGYIDKENITDDMVYASETALSEKTMLNPSKVVTYAIEGKKFDKKRLMDELIDPQKQVKLELWAYNPKLFSNDETVDNLSLILSFEENNDERIEEAIEEILERELKE